MSSEIVISASGLGKCYQIYEVPRDRLLQMLLRGRKQFYREFWAIRNISLEIRRGEAVGIVGRNGAGKSTLLQMICGTLNPTEGRITVDGRVSALLELGAGFNPEFTGKENVFLSAAVMGLPEALVAQRYDDIVGFSGIGDFIDQPVKTYSSGMYVRLAFSVATSVDPDILVVDEALSVGDGEFARKSFDRIMALKEQGTTILFCSHALYQVESFCEQVLWLDKGETVMLDRPKEVISNYKSFLLDEKIPASIPSPSEKSELQNNGSVSKQGQGYFTLVETAMDGVYGNQLEGLSGTSELRVKLGFFVDPRLPPPVIGVNIDYGTKVAITTAVTQTDKVDIKRDAAGYGFVEITFPKLALRKGDYFVSVYLACEKAIHFYDHTVRVASISMQDPFPEPGLVALPHHWRAEEKNVSQSSCSDLRFVVLPWGDLVEVDEADSLRLRYNDGIFEPEETKLCQTLVKEGDRVLDVGANLGYYALLFSSIVAEQGNVVAIEPDPENYALLKKNIVRNQMTNVVTTHEVALGKTAHTAQLYQAQTSAGMHRLYASVCCSEQHTDVAVITGDSLDLAPLDFIKIDVEGYEPYVLDGLTETLANSPNVKILSEFSPLSIWEAGLSPRDFLIRMSRGGFRLVTYNEGQWARTEYDVFVQELSKIPETAIPVLVESLQHLECTDNLMQQAVEFLRGHGYLRPLVENILFVAPRAWSSVCHELHLDVTPT